MKITLKNCWEHRDEFVRRFKEKNPLDDEITKLDQAVIDEKRDEYLAIIHRHFGWCVDEKVFNYPFDFCDNFIDGIARVRVKGKWGYIKANGNWLFKPQFDGCRSFYDGFARVQTDKKWGYVKNDGSWLIQPEFDWADRFCCGYAQVRTGNRLGHLYPDGSINWGN